MTIDPEQRRKQAIERYLTGDKIEDICKTMACSKSFLYKWRDRYHSGDPDWARAKNRRPVKTPTQIPEIIAQHIVQLRHNAKGVRSAPAIWQILKQQGIEPLPSLRTIYRILYRQERR
jgi:transposase-like protein